METHKSTVFDLYIVRTADSIKSSIKDGFGSKDNPLTFSVNPGLQIDTIHLAIAKVSEACEAVIFYNISICNQTPIKFFAEKGSEFALVGEDESSQLDLAVMRANANNIFSINCI